MRTLLLALLLPALASAQVSYPMITHTHPVAVQRGKTAAVTVSGAMNFAETTRALFEGPGLRAAVIPEKMPEKTARAVRLEVTADAAATPGVRDFRVAGDLGLSSVGQIVITDHPVVEEQPKNDTREAAQAVPVPCVVAGKVEAAEDADHYKFRAKAGQTVTFEVFCARIQDRIHDLQKHADPIVTVYDSAGRELAANDDFYFADPLVAVTFKADGEYVVQVRDSKYDGDPRWVYALMIDSGPHPTHVFPPAARAGAPVTLEAVGTGLTARLTAPASPGVHEVVLDTAKGKSAPVPLIVSALPQAVEAEPNDDPARATRLALPCGINGRVGKPGDVDHYTFAAKKAAAVRFEVKARRFGTRLLSSLDSVIDVLNSRGAVLATSDDLNGKDAALAFTPPADGDYVLRVRDLNGKGGPTAVYHVEAEPVSPDFTLKVDGDKAMIGPGGSAAWYVQLTRLGGFTGPVKIDVKGLPQGVTVNPLTVAPGQVQGLLVLSATADARITAAEVTVSGTGEPGTRPAQARQEIYFPGGGRGTIDVAAFAVAVVRPGDLLKVTVTPDEVNLKPGGEVRLDVTVERAAGFDKGVSLDVTLRHLGQVYGNTLPPGVTVVEAKSKTLLGSGSKGHLVLRAAPGSAAADRVPVSVLAHVSVNFVVKQSYSSAVVPVSVRP
ncbi:MAG: PPC domain-containing protein [Gemmataceae bacterium]